VRYKGELESHRLNLLYVVFTDGKNYWIESPPEQIPGFDAHVQFTQIDPEKGRFELTLNGISKKPADEWILITGKEKPLVSLVWLGTFILMAGFSISVFQHRKSHKKAANSQISDF